MKYEYKKKTNFSFLFKNYLYKIHSVDSIFYISNIQNIYFNFIYTNNLQSISISIYSSSYVPSKLKNNRSDIVFYLHIILPLPLIAIKPFIPRAKNLPDETLDFISLSKKDLQWYGMIIATTQVLFSLTLKNLKTFSNIEGK